MEFTPRMTQILNILLTEAKAVPVLSLAEKTGCSKRTVQREMKYIPQSLVGYELELVSKTGVGVWLEGSSEEKQRLLLSLRDADSFDAGNPHERRKRLIIKILREKGIKKLYYYSSFFKVSEATISADLDAIEGWLSKFNLTINRQPGTGVKITGTESSYRRAISAFISENIDAKSLKEAYQLQESKGVHSKLLHEHTMIHVLDEAVMQKVVSCISELGSSKILSLTENSYIGLIVHISVAVNRILKGEVIEPPEHSQEKLQSLAKDADYSFAAEIAKCLGRSFEIEIPQVEILYICMHLKGLKHEKIPVELSEQDGIHTLGMQNLVNKLINAFDSEKAFLLRQDEDFIQGLLAHLQPTIIRLTYGMQIHNPMLAEIKDRYADIFKRCQSVAEVLSDELKRAVPEEEIGFLVVHFGAALVRMESQNAKLRKVHIGVVCSSGIGVSRLMCSKLTSVFREQVELTSYGKYDLTQHINAQIDFYVSSIDLGESSMPVIQVSPLLSTEDIDKIEKLVHKYARMPAKQEAQGGFAEELEKVNLLSMQISKVIKSLDYIYTDARIEFEELLQLLDERLSSKERPQKLIYEALRQREKVSSQIFAEFGFALLHARTDGVTEPVFKICLPEAAESFQAEYMKRIKVALVMLIPLDANLDINTKIMGSISSMLIEQPEFIATACTGSRAEASEMLAGSLKKFFTTCLAGI